MKKLTMLLTGVAAVLALALPAAAAAKDRNHDNLPDGWEKAHKLSLDVKQGHRDQDRDGLKNRGEFKADDNPRDRDTDDDAVKDGNENAGTIASFDNASGELVINEFGGGTVSGLVTDATRIECEDRDDDADENETEVENHRDHGSGGSSGSGSSGSGSGDDNSGSGSGGGDDNSGPGSANSGPGHDGDDDANRTCTTADLTPGAPVQEAELESVNGQAVFEEIELVK